MKHEKAVKITLIVLPILTLILYVIPGMVSYSGIEKFEGVKYMLIEYLPEGTVSNVSRLTLLITVFTVAMGFVYRNAPGRASSRMYMILNIVNLLFSLAPMGVDEYLNLSPYWLVPAMYAVMLAVSIPVCIKETELYYDRATEYYE